MPHIADGSAYGSAVDLYAALPYTGLIGPNLFEGKMHSVVETADYLADAKEAGLSDDERRKIVDYLAHKPDGGTGIPGTGGARKIRFGGRGKGKSGGYRVITFYSGESVPVFLLNVFSKGDKVNLSQAERNELRNELAGLVSDYLTGVHTYVQGG